MHRTFIVVNPAAGRGLAGRLWPGIAEKLKRAIGPFDFAISRHPEDVRRLAKKAAREGYSRIVACGGDGTIHEVVNGICDTVVPRRGTASNAPALGILSVGTGGDLIKTLAIPARTEEQIRILARGKTRSIDLGHVSYTNENGKTEKRIFVNIADAGIGAEVLRHLPAARRLVGRRLAYLYATVRSFLVWRPPEVRSIPTLSLPLYKGRVGEGILSVIIANGRYFGRGMPIAPEARPDDGLFDLIVIREMNPILGILSIPLLFAKKLNLLPHVFSERVRKVTLTSDEKVGLDIDGEPVGFLPATFTILSKALTVMTP